MSLVRVFATYDLDRDERLFRKLLKQSHKRGSPFQIVDRTTPDSLSSTSAESLRARIRRVDQLVVLCAEWTHRAENVNLELRIAQEESIPYFLLKGPLFGEGSRPATAVMGDRIYRWSTDTLYSLLQGAR